MGSLKFALFRLARRIFIPMLLFVDTIVLSLAIGGLVVKFPGALSVGVGAAASMGFLTYLTAGKTARTNKHLLWVTAADIVALTVASVAWLPVLPAVTAAGVLHLAYVYWYSSLDRSGPTPLKIGQPLPEFVVESVDGCETASNDLRQQPRVILFYRGNWCPLCMAQISEIAADYQALEQRGYRVTLISPQPSDNTEELAQRFDVSFDFYVDAGGAAADILGIKHVGGTPAGIALGYDGDTVLPTVIITDSSGVVRWLDLTDNYRIRPEPATFLEVIDSFASDSVNA